MNARRAIELFHADVSEKSVPVSDGFEKIYQNLKKELFTRKSEVAMDKGKRDSIDKVRYLLENGIGSRDYLVDLLGVIESYDSLPGRYLKQIRQLSSNSIENDIRKLMEEVTHKYLIDIINRAESIDEAEELIILAEEF